MIPLIVGAPTPRTLSVQEHLVVALRTPVTLAWHDRGALEASAAAVLDLGGTSLYVDVDDEGLGHAALGHQLQVFGPPAFVVVVATGGEGSSWDRVAAIVLSDMPPSAVVVIGDDVEFGRVRELAAIGELDPPIRATDEDIVELATDLFASARWQTV